MAKNKFITFVTDADLDQKVRERARAENRSISNLVERIVRLAMKPDSAEMPSAPAPSPVQE